MGKLDNIEPKRVMHYFEEISNIPRGSYNETEISNYLVDYAIKHELEYYQDKLNNVIMIKDASEGYEKEEPIIIQGHMDMVCEKVQGSSHDFTKDPLDLYVEDGFLKARDTTLGGDDGIAVAMALAILEDDEIKHPRLEVVITTSEEVGMDGAAGINLSMLKGHTMLNLDSEEEGSFLTGCAGGSSTELRLPVTYDVVSKHDWNVKKNEICCKLTVDGLLGGHSGAEIHKGRAQAGMLLGRVFMAFNRGRVEFDIASFKAGNKENVISCYGESEIVVYDYDAAKAVVEAVEATTREEYQIADPDIRINLEKLDMVAPKKLSDKSKRDVVFMLGLSPYGIQKMSENIKGLVETSLNPGIIEISDGIFRMVYSVRSSVNGAKRMLNDKLREFAEYVGAEILIRGDYPAWEFKVDSPLRDKMVRIYEEMYGKKPVIEAIHAGLECGLLSEKIKNLDCVAMGPDILDIHTPKERLDLESTRRSYEFVLRVLADKN